jgi:hypothetical protein
MMMIPTPPPTQDATIATWHGERNRAAKVRRPCPCGCDARTGPIAEGKAVGYLSGSNADGEGFTLWIPDEPTYEVLKAVFGEGK